MANRILGCSGNQNHRDALIPSDELPQEFGKVAGILGFVAAVGAEYRVLVGCMRG